MHLAWGALPGIFIFAVITVLPVYHSSQLIEVTHLTEYMQGLGLIC